MSCTPSDNAIAKARLRERIRTAEAAYDRILLGTAVKVIQDGPGGERVEFQMGNREKLADHIAMMKAELAALDGEAFVHPRATRPLTFSFGGR